MGLLDDRIDMHDANRRRLLGQQPATGRLDQRDGTCQAAIIKAGAVPSLGFAAGIKVLSAIGRGKGDRAGNRLPTASVETSRDFPSANSTCSSSAHFGGP